MRLTGVEPTAIRLHSQRLRPLGHHDGCGPVVRIAASSYRPVICTYIMIIHYKNLTEINFSTF